MIVQANTRFNSTDLRTLSQKSLGPQIKVIDHDYWIRNKGQILNNTTAGPRMSISGGPEPQLVNKNYGFEKSGASF
jgi:hypothetical protein